MKSIIKIIALLAIYCIANIQTNENQSEEGIELTNQIQSSNFYKQLSSKFFQKATFDTFFIIQFDLPNFIYQFILLICLDNEEC